MMTFFCFGSSYLKYSYVWYARVLLCQWCRRNFMTHFVRHSFFLNETYCNNLVITCHHSLKLQEKEKQQKKRRICEVNAVIKKCKAKNGMMMMMTMMSLFCRRWAQSTELMAIMTKRRWRCCWCYVGVQGHEYKEYTDPRQNDAFLVLYLLAYFVWEKREKIYYFLWPFCSH